MEQYTTFVCVLVCLMCLNQFTRSEVHEVQCKGKTFQIDEEQQLELKECLSVVGITSIKQLSAETGACFSRCAMVKKGLIDDAGMPHKEKIMNIIDTHVPEDIRSAWKVAIEKCLDIAGSKLDMNDPKCASFLPLAMCAHKAFVDICKS